MRLKPLLGPTSLAAGLLLLLPNSASAITFTFGYNQTSCTAGPAGPGTATVFSCPTNGIVGTGSFTAPNGVSSVTLANLTAFSFTNSIGGQSVTYTKPNLTSFTASINTATGVLSSFAFQATFGTTATPLVGAQSFSANGFPGSNTASFGIQGLRNSINSGGNLTNFATAPDPVVPEPSPMLPGLLTATLFGGAAVLKRRTTPADQ